MTKSSNKTGVSMDKAVDPVILITDFSTTPAFAELKELKDLDPHIHSMVEAVETLTKPAAKPAITHFFITKLSRASLHLATALEGGKKNGWLVDEEGVINARGRALEKAVRLLKPLSDGLATH